MLGIWELFKPRSIRWVIIALIMLNAIDGILTINWVGSGIATEANPLMNLLITTNPLLFMTIKLLLVSLGAYLLWCYRNRTLAVVSLYFCVLVYSLVMVQHLNTGLLL